MASKIETFVTPCQPKLRLDLQGNRTSAGSELNCATWNWSSARAVLPLFQMKFPQIVQENDNVFPPHPVFHRGKGRHNFAATISRDDACHLMPAGAKRKLGMQCKRLRSLRAQLCPAYRECQGAHVIARHVKFACKSMLYLFFLKNRGMQTNPTYNRLLQRPAWKGRDGKVWVGLHNGDLEPLRYDDVTCMLGQASQRLYCEFCIQCFSHVIPVVPHKAVAEVSKIGNL